MADRPPHKFELIPKANAGEHASSSQSGGSPESDAPMRMPSSAMNVDLPSEESAIVPAYTQRRPYAPPKLSHPMPGKVKMVEPGSPAISQWLATVVRALRGMTMYADNNSRRKDFIDQSFAVLDEIFMKVMRLDLVVAPDHIAYGRDLLHFNPDPFESLPRILYDGAVRKLTITRGVTALELVRLLGVIATDFSRSENGQDDLVSILGRMGMPHIRAKGPDAVVQAPKYVPPAPIAVEIPRPPPTAGLPAPTPRPAPKPVREEQPPRLPSAFFQPILEEEPVPEPLSEPLPDPLTMHADALDMIDPFAEDDEATVLGEPAHTPKKAVAAPLVDDEATLQEGATAPRIDISDLLDEATAQEGSKKE